MSLFWFSWIYLMGVCWAVLLIEPSAKKLFPERYVSVTFVNATIWWLILSVHIITLVVSTVTRALTGDNKKP